MCYGWLNLTDGEDIDFVYLKFCGFQSLEELRERREWVRMRANWPFMLSMNMDKKGVQSLFKQMGERFYWEEKKQEQKWTLKDIERIKKHFNE